MGGRVGGKSHKIYRETRGVKVSDGEPVTSGKVLTRCGDQWKPGLNVLGLMHLTAARDGKVYFTKKRNHKNGRIDTFVNVRPEPAKKS